MKIETFLWRVYKSDVDIFQMQPFVLEPLQQHIEPQQNRKNSN